MLYFSVCVGFKEAVSFIVNGITIKGAMVKLFTCVVLTAIALIRMQYLSIRDAVIMVF